MLVDGKWMPNHTCPRCRYRHPKELTCLQALEAATSARAESQTCQCELCGRETRMMGTRRCDGCWELETRIHRDPELARQILEDHDRLLAEKGQEHEHDYHPDAG